MSTKVTLLYGKNFHIYYDYAVEMGHKVLLDINGENVVLPPDLEEALTELIQLHRACKEVIKMTERLDRIDGGIFGLNLNTGEKTEFDGEGFK